MKKEDLKELLLMLSLFPSLEIDISVFEKCFDDENIKNKLIKLEKNGWLDKKESSFKLHQIIKEYLKRREVLDYEKVKFIFKRVADFINPEDLTVNGNSLVYYIPVIESFLNDYEKYEDRYIIELNDSLTFLYYSLAKYEKALAIQDKMLELRERLFGEETNEYAKGLNLKAIVFKELGKYSEALKLHNQAISLRKNKEELKKELAISYINISMIYININNKQEALAYASMSLKISEEILNDKDIFLSSIYNNISLIYKSFGDYKKALAFAIKGFEITEEVLDKNHIDLSLSYNNISTIYQDLKELDLALEYSKKSLEMSQRILDKNHPNLAKNYNNMAHIYKDLKECKNAKEYMVKAKRIFSLYEYKNSDVFYANQFIKNIEQNTKKEEKLNYKKRGKFCKD